MKFGSAEELRAQIARDVDAARAERQGSIDTRYRSASRE